MKKYFLHNAELRAWAKVFALLSALSFALDQLVKAIQRSQMQLRESIPLIKGVFHLTSVQNTGAAFSFLEGKINVFLAISGLVIAAILLYMLFVRPRTFYPVVGLALLLGGSAGNMFDRAAFGHVYDIFDFRLINFAIFNVADVCITFAVIALGIWILFFDMQASRKVELKSEFQEAEGFGQSEQEVSAGQEAETSCEPEPETSLIGVEH